MPSDRASRHPAFSYICDPVMVVIALAVVLAVHGEKLISFTLGIDGEFYSYDHERFWLNWISQGRWAMGLMVAALPPFSAMPIIATSLFCAGLAAAALLLAPLLAESRKLAVLFVGLFAANPLWAHIAEFGTLSWGAGVCLLCLAGSLWSLVAGRLLAAIALLAFAAGIYQSALFLFAAAAIPLGVPNPAFWRLPQGSVPFRNVAIVALAGTVLTGLVGKGALLVSGQELSYVTGYVHLDAVSTLPGILDIARQVVHRMLALELGLDATFLGWGVAVMAPLWIGGAVALVRFVRAPAPWLARAGQALAVLAVAGTLFLPLLLTADTLPLRALIMVPFLGALVGLNAFRFERLQWAQWSVWGYGLLVSAWIGTSFNYANEITYQRDTVMAARLMERIELVGRPAFGSGKLPIALVGYWTYDTGGPARHLEVFGDSFFEHDAGNVFRVIDFLRYLGLRGVEGVPLNQVQGAEEAAQTMPSWPAAGSVAVVGKVVLVKLGSLSPPQLLELRK